MLYPGISHWCPCPGLLVCGGRIVVADALVVDVCHDLGPCRVIPMIWVARDKKY